MRYHSLYSDWAAGWVVWGLNPSRGKNLFLL